MIYGLVTFDFVDSCFRIRVNSFFYFLATINPTHFHTVCVSEQREDAKAPHTEASSEIDKELYKAFQKIAGDDLEIYADRLQGILNSSFKRGSYIDANRFKNVVNSSFKRGSSVDANRFKDILNSSFKRGSYIDAYRFKDVLNSSFEGGSFTFFIRFCMSTRKNKPVDRCLAVFKSWGKE